MSTRSMWKGTLKFGLLNIPVAMYGATNEPNDTPLRQLHKSCGNPINKKDKCTPCSLELTAADIIKGYEHTKGQFVQLTAEELDSIKPESTKIIDVESFTAANEIDLIYYDRPYYLGPNGPVAYQAFAALREALKRTKKVGLASLTMYGHDNLMAIRPEGKGLLLQRVRERREVRAIEALPGYEELPATAVDAHVNMVEQVIGSMEADFDPTVHTDSTREQLVKLIQSKLEGTTYEAPKAEELPATQDIMSALTQTLAQAKTIRKKMAKAAKAEEEPVSVAAPAKKSRKKAA